uniref:Uncharacterized protein n=1 Tax=Heterorhabditis bacteriophora TaxID=37862 RepID=A0A1I7WQU3_HETBA
MKTLKIREKKTDHQTYVLEISAAYRPSASKLTAGSVDCGLLREWPKPPPQPAPYLRQECTHTINNYFSFPLAIRNMPRWRRSLGTDGSSHITECFTPFVVYLYSHNNTLNLRYFLRFFVLYLFFSFSISSFKILLDIFQIGQFLIVCQLLYSLFFYFPCSSNTLSRFALIFKIITRLHFIFYGCYASSLEICEISIIKTTVPLFILKNPLMEHYSTRQTHILSRLRRRFTRRDFRIEVIYSGILATFLRNNKSANYLIDLSLSARGRRNLSNSSHFITLSDSHWNNTSSAHVKTLRTEESIHSRWTLHLRQLRTMVDTGY